MSDKGDERRRSERKPLTEEMEFILYLDAYKAKSINLSETGISFETEMPLVIRLQVEKDGKPYIRDAKLIWATKSDKGGLTYGFEFIPDMDDTKIPGRE